MNAVKLKRCSPPQLEVTRLDPVDAATRATVETIVSDVRERGEAAVREHAQRLGDVEAGGALVIQGPSLQRALARFRADDPEACSLLERTAARIRNFALAQRETLKPLELQLAGVRAGHGLAPMESAGCYAPGGRYPLPSSVLMTAVTARAAGVRTVWVASPRPPLIIQAAAAIAGADGLLAVGGAQAIAALAFGAGSAPACDAVVGPGNRFVTAAKELVAGRVAIDMLAGPSEVLVLADHTADARLIAADLLAQAEHDPDARAVLVTTEENLIGAVETELDRQLADLATAAVARAALDQHGLAVHVADLEEAVQVANRLAPEHLEVLVANPEALRHRLHHYGALFLGAGAAEVFGDYGLGPNHVLPTAGTARSRGGLSVFTFLRVRTWLSSTQGPERHWIEDAAALARLEGLEAHARAARLRLGDRKSAQAHNPGGSL